MYLLLRSVSVTAKKCDCNFSVKIKVLNCKMKIRRAFLKFSKIRGLKKIKIHKIRIRDLRTD